MKLDLATLYGTDPLKACKLAMRRTRNVPERARLDSIGKLLGTHGTEAIRGEWENGYWCDIVAAYCNTGDTYALTVLQDRERGFMVTSWGDWIGRNGERLGAQ